MSEKDITEKILADYNDVFADIVNVLLFNGEQVVSADDLETVKDRSQYKADGQIHQQERDVSKILKSGNTKISLLGFEHQTEAEKYMPLRQIGYDGQSYRAQLLERDVKRTYPVITLVLYFGTKHWNYERNLLGVLDVPEEFRSYVSDYEMKNLFEIAFLTPEQVQLFRSDFKHVADYFVQKRLNNDYQPSKEALRHVDEMLKLMSVLTDDTRFEDVIWELSGKGGTSMCTVLDKVESRGREEGREEGRLEGKEEGKLEGMTQVYYTKLHYSADQIAAELDAPVDVIRQLIDGILNK